LLQQLSTRHSWQRLLLLLLLLLVVQQANAMSISALLLLFESLVDLKQLHFEVEISIRWNDTASSFAAIAVVASDVQLALLAKRHLQCRTNQHFKLNARGL
jgi:hypothetical protein